MVSKVYPSFDAAVADVPDGARIMFSGFAAPGTPQNLIAALLRQGARNLTAISNRPGGGVGVAADAVDVGRLIAGRRIKKMVCAFTAPTRATQTLVFDQLYEAGDIEAELVPQGTLAERIRAAGAGLGGFYTPTGVGTEVADGKEVRRIGDRDYLFETPLDADYAFLRAHRADCWGNLQFRLAQRNFGPIMAQAARTVIVEVEEDIVEPGELDPDQIHTPGIYVHRLIKIPPPPEGLWDTAGRA
jgi:3-oxoadipate CoA-transferase alpha subunit